MDNLATEPNQPDTDLELEESTEEVEALDPLDGDQSEADSEEQETEDDVQELLDLDGEEVDLETVRKWKSGHLMQEDYTRKTQALSEERKTLKTQAESLESIVSELEAELLSDFDQKAMDELREYDASAYLKMKEKYDARRNKIASAKATAAKKRDELDETKAVEERGKLVQSNPDWLDATGNITEKYKTDTAMMSNYLVSKGWTKDEIADISTAKQWLVIKEAAELNASRAKNDSIKQKVKKAPMVTKPRSNSAPAKPKSLAETLYGE